MISPALQTRRKITASEFHRMGEAGILGEDDRVELIEGDLIEMAPIGFKHAGIVARLTKLLIVKVPNNTVVWTQNPVRLDDFTEPQPDICLLRLRSGDYLDAFPGSGDLLLAIEAADSSLDYDRTAKLRLYAQNGIPEAWIVNLNEKRLECHAFPENGGYRQSEHFGTGQSVAPAAFPQATIDLADLFA